MGSRRSPWLRPLGLAGGARHESSSGCLTHLSALLSATVTKVGQGMNLPGLRVAPLLAILLLLPAAAFADPQSFKIYIKTTVGVTDAFSSDFNFTAPSVSAQHKFD